MEKGKCQSLEEDIKGISERLDTLERELRLLSDPEVAPDKSNIIEVQGSFFEVMQALRALYLDEKGDREQIKKISKDIEQGRIKVDLADLFFRFFVRQEIQNARIKMLILSQKLDVSTSLFDQLDDLAVLIDDPRISIHQVIIGWKRFERTVVKELSRLQKQQVGKG